MTINSVDIGIFMCVLFWAIVGAIYFFYRYRIAQANWNKTSEKLGDAIRLAGKYRQLADEGQYAIFNFDTVDSEFDFAVDTKRSLSSVTFTRRRPGKPDDIVFIWLKAEWLDKIREKLPERETNEKRAESSI